MAVRTSPIDFALIGLLGLLGGSALAPAALLTKRVVNELASPDRGQHTTTVIALAILASAMTALGAAATYLAGIPAYRLAAKIQLKTETELAKACGRIPGVEALEDATTQDRLLLAQRGAHQAPQLVTSTISQLLTTISRTGAFIAVLWAAFPPMVLALLVSVLPLVGLQRRVNRRAIGYNEQANQAYRWRDYFTQLFTNPASAREMRLYVAQEQLVARLRERLADGLAIEMRRNIRLAGAQLGFALVNAAVAGAGAAWVVTEIANGTLTVGDFLLFTGAVVSVQAALQGLLHAWGSIGISAAVFEHYLRFVELADSLERAGGTREAPPLSQGVEFRDVWFHYPGSSDWALRGLNLQVRAGELTALVGLNGAGKSSALSLLLRFYEPQRGVVLWDGIDISTLRPASLRGRICGVLQDHGYYELSVLDNIALGNAGQPVDRATARQAAATANILAAIERLPRGFDTMLSTRRADSEGSTGVSLSGGEWQRLALARALVRADGDLLVLDEANSGLDVAAEQVLDALLARLQGQTRLVITHRLHTISQADQIYLLAGGTVVESGSHAELLAIHGQYAALVTSAEPPKLAISEPHQLQQSQTGSDTR